MGYTTNFDGEFTVTPTLKPEHKAYLEAFNRSRRMIRDAAKAEALPDPVRLAAGLPIGDTGAYYVGSHEEDFGQTRDASIIDDNKPPNGQPSLWCQWVPSEDGSVIVWDDGEKFYEYVAWIEYLIEHFLAPWGYALNGKILWQGEDNDDRGYIHVKDNRVRAIQTELVDADPVW